MSFPYTDTTPDSDNSGQNSITTIVVIVVIVCVVVVILKVALICWICKRIKLKKLAEYGQWHLPQQTELQKYQYSNSGPKPESFDPGMQIAVPRFSFASLQQATRGFSQERLLGKGGFGSVYKGTLQNGSMVAVKVMSETSDQGYSQFLAELSVIGRLVHKHLVALKGWCKEGANLVLVYDYMPNGSLDHHLFGSNNILPWSERLEIAKGVAEGLNFLHFGWEQRILHRDIKASNVLLDDNLVPRLGDFGLAKLLDQAKEQQTMTAAGTRGYIAPELAFEGRASEKSDIYSFGILLLEIASGRHAVDTSEQSGRIVLLDWVWDAQEKGQILQVVDSRLQASYNQYEMLLVLCLGLLCTTTDPELRPSSRKCCSVLNGEAALPPVPSSRPSAWSALPIQYSTTTTSIS